MTRLNSLGDPPPLEDRGPLSPRGCPLEEPIDACEYLRKMESLGQDVRHLSRGRDLDEPHLTILDDLVGEVLPDVDVLGTFPAADDVVTPFDAPG